MNTARSVDVTKEDDGNILGNETETVHQELAAANTRVFGQEENPWELLKAIKNLTGSPST